MEFVRREFVIEDEEDSGDVVARDPGGAIVARGTSTSDVISSLQALPGEPGGQLIRLSALIRYRPDGRIGLIGTYRMVRLELGETPTSRPA